MNNCFLLPFDHRGSFQEKLFGIVGRSPQGAELERIQDAKRIVYEGFLLSSQSWPDPKDLGILVDEQFGSQILIDAQKAGFMTALPVERSGQDEFDFEYGLDFEKHLTAFNPTFAKVLVRYNPEGDPDLNARQVTRLKKLSDSCKAKKIGLMFELLVPATARQAETGKSQFDQELRPKLMIQAIGQLQEAGIDPALWKLEGVDKPSDAQALVQAAQSKGRTSVGIIVLGRGENAQKVDSWLEVASKTTGFCGFAVGRTIFWEPLLGWKNGTKSRAEAVDEISKRYLHCLNVWCKNKS